MRPATPNPVQRYLLATLDHALHRLAGERGSDRNIHDARRDLKRARATLRLLRPALGEQRYKAHNYALRDAGRLIAPLRDARSMIDAFDALVEHAADAVGAGRVRAIRATLRADLDFVRRHLHPRSREVTACRRIIRRQRAGLARAPLPSPALPQSLAGIYRRARKAGRAITPESSPEVLHEWRKRVKHVRNATAALQGLAGKPAARASARADHLGDVLGYDHDLAILAIVLSSKSMTSPDLDVGHQVEALIAARRARLQRRARELGAALFEMKPARFVKQVLGSSG